ncbi:hypothetical protein RCCGE510_29516 (plasmid) [Rhizobium sp. CCGE 510]|nr:hypothetical protein RCCGE510_29516 [Rhizobium sp. CCGE 510]
MIRFDPNYADNSVRLLGGQITWNIANPSNTISLVQRIAVEDGDSLLIYLIDMALLQSRLALSR